MPVVIAFPLAAESVEPLIERFEWRSLQVGAGGVDLAEGVDKQCVSVAVVGIDKVRICVHCASYVLRLVATLFYDTIIPLLTMEIKEQTVNNL